jgi:RNA polymerase sigma-70 factor (ECF subfamily)
MPTNLESIGLAERLEQHRAELTAFSQRMLGASEAEDSVQETFLRALRSFERFEGRAPLRSWLYRIATNVCLDMLEGRKRRARPIDLASAREPSALMLCTALKPVLDVRGSADNPEEAVLARESVRLAFVAALQHLPPRQRAVLILRGVLCWQASEVAELLETSVASVNSALQRARATLQTRETSASDSSPTDGAARAQLLSRYVDAFERYDMEALMSVLQEDATSATRCFTNRQRPDAGPGDDRRRRQTQDR